MDRSDLLDDRTKRRKFGLTPELRMRKLDDPSGNKINDLRSDSDWTTADITVSTTADQIPIAPGTKMSDTTENGRHTCRFVSDAPIQDFFSIQSAKYQVATAKLGDVNLAIYYDAAHPMNIQRMLGAEKSALTILPQIFTPYQFHQARIQEFPAYANFAESFANTIPYSESIGFVVNVQDPDAVDTVTYVTAHELGHQWWGHQLSPAAKQGSTMLTESFAQYSAMMVMEHLQGEAQLRKYLKYELDAYLRARSATEVIEELPLNRVEDKPYIHYRKGSGGDVFPARSTWRGCGQPRHARYPARFRLQTRALPGHARFHPLPAPGSRPRPRPGDYRQPWNASTLYDVNVRTVHATPRADGKFDVTIDVDAHKYYARRLRQGNRSSADRGFRRRRLH